MKRKQGKKQNSERWLLTYSDLITLLMILFVVLYALSSVDQGKYKMLSDSLSEALGNRNSQGGSGVLNGSESILDGGSGILDNDGSTNESTEETTEPPTEADTNESSITESQEGKLLKIQTDIIEILKNSDIQNDVYFTIEDRGLVISFVDNIFFDSAQADIKEEMKQDIDKIASVLQTIDNSICIEGHTDNVPISTSMFASNWQLSCVRAANVAQYLAEQDGIAPERLSAAGYGEYKPIATNDTEEGRSKNRRVNFVILYKYVEE